MQPRFDIRGDSFRFPDLLHTAWPPYARSKLTSIPSLFIVSILRSRSLIVTPSTLTSHSPLELYVRLPPHIPPG